ncbi:MAG: glycosyltransferase family 2 protein [Phycisphaeraceae bacterium]|nr:glycosyltransferase family 2 protein [Phycisphaeraceae bacterium]
MIDVMIIAHNERLNLPHCLRSLTGWVHQVFVIDSGSTDGTVEIAREMGAQVHHHPWEGYARQKNWGLENLPWESPWVMILDADEGVPEELRKVLVGITSRPAEEVRENGFFINRLTYFMNRPLRHCGYFPSWNLRLFKRGMAKYEDRLVHEHMLVPEPVGYIHEAMFHNDRRGLEHYIAKHNRYSTLEAQSLWAEIVASRTGTLAKESLPADARRRRWLKQHVLPRIPAPWVGRFLYMYIFKLGILDGRSGLEFCQFIAMYDFMVSLKLREIRRAVRDGEMPVSQTKPIQGLAVAEGEERPAGSGSDH